MSVLFHISAAGRAKVPPIETIQRRSDQIPVRLEQAWTPGLFRLDLSRAVFQQNNETGGVLMRCVVGNAFTVNTCSSTEGLQRRIEFSIEWPNRFACSFRHGLLQRTIVRVHRSSNLALVQSPCSQKVSGG
jgi:hypothetical protein